VVSPLPDSHSALHINLTHLRSTKRFGHLQEDHIKQWRIGESALLPLFSSESALPYYHPDSGGVVKPSAWRHGPCSDGWLQPQITAGTLTLLDRLGLHLPAIRAVCTVPLPHVACKIVSRGPDKEQDSLLEPLTYFMHSSCILGPAPH
jgi:hypothetical protein